MKETLLAVGQAEATRYFASTDFITDISSGREQVAVNLYDRIQKACDLSKDENGKLADVRMLISLARVQIRRGQTVRAKGTLRSVLGRIDELTEFEKQEFEELRKSAR